MATTQIYHASQTRLVFRMASGRRVMLYDDGSGIEIKSSPDGITWTAPTVLSSAPAWSSLIGIDLVADVLYLWWGATNVANVTLYALGSGGAPGAATLVHAPLSATSIINITTSSVCYDGSGTWHVFSGGLNSGFSVAYAILTAFTIAGGAATQVSQQVLALSEGLLQATVVARGSRIFVVAKGVAFTGLYALVAQFSGSYGVLSIEGAGATGGDFDIVLAIDQNGFLDIIERKAGPTGSLLAIKRTGVGVYNTQTLVASGVTDVPMIAEDQASGDAFVFYRSTLNFATGEILAIPRVGGTWLSPELVQGGSGTGYRWTNVGRSSYSGIVDVVYERGTGIGDTVEYEAFSIALAPGQPVMLTPSGATPTPPAYHWNYVNSMLSNPQGAFRLVVTLDSDASTQYDSGWVTSSSTTYQPVSTLPTGVGLHVTVQTKDALTSTASPISAALGFSLVAAPDPSIIGVTAHGSAIASGDSVTHVDLTMTIQHAQVGSDGMSAAQLALFPYPLPAPLDGTTTGAVAVGSPQTYSPYKAVGDQVTLSLDATGTVVTGHSYALVAFDTDAVTGAVGWTPIFTLTVVPAPLDPITDFHITATNPQLGKFTLAWTNPSGAIANRLSHRRSAPAGTPGMPDWEVIYQGAPITSFPWYAPTYRPFDYRVEAQNSAGEWFA